MVGSDKERPKGRVGSGSDNARGSPILSIFIYIISERGRKSGVACATAATASLASLPIVYLEF